MTTFYTNNVEEAATYIKNGGLVAFPTETVYGLGADVFNEQAIEKIFLAKGRPSDNPLIAHIGNVEDIGLLASEVPPSARKFIEKFFPGPLTLVLPKSGNVPPIATAGLDTIGVRMPKHELAQAFIKACGTPLVAPSANLSGKPSPTTWQAVYEDLNGRIDCILQGEPTEVGLESTVVDCTGDAPLVLRAGAVSLEQLQSVVPETRMYVPDSVQAPRSPGLKHRHYSPEAAVILIDNTSEAMPDNSNAYIGLDEVDKGSFGLARVCEDSADYAHSVFNFFRECDRQGIKIIYCQRVEERGIGLALMDRLKRASKR